ncbi:MAG: hypothetical protein Q8K72_16280, partial [Acidimicrobiales bacterium]|nr:hypothetical protein [Acidimicrobiales bacterium]
MALRRLFGKTAEPAARLDRHRATFRSTRGDLPIVGYGQTASYSMELFDAMERWRTKEVPRLADDVAASWAVAL